MSFYQRYDLERLLADGEAKTFRAKENASGRPVFLHMFNPSGESILAAMKAKLTGPQGKPVWPLIELGDFAGSPYAVTEPIEPFTSLREWVASANPMAAVAEKPKAGSTTAQFTSLFDDAEPLRVEKKSAELFPAAPPPVTAPEPGEFTRMFYAGAPRSEPAPAALPKAAEPDEFERLFGSPSAPPSAPAPKPISPIPAETGEFTRRFGLGPSGEPIDIEEEQARAARIAPPENRPFQAPGEFTRMFGPQRTPAPPPPSPPAPTHNTAIGTASQLFGDDAPTVRTAVPRTQSGPGEYTRMFAAPRNPADAAAEKPPEVAPAPVSSRRGWMIGLSIGAAVLVIAIVVVVIVYARSK
ncbi:MAG: hypothetical protein LAO79_20480 [Acidobacteriia bacterium]|nr:hypothetical protein [Terriglobia bacterium]